MLWAAGPAPPSEPVVRPELTTEQAAAAAKCSARRRHRLCRHPIQHRPVAEEPEPQPPPGPDDSYMHSLTTFHRRRLLRLRQETVGKQGMRSLRTCLPKGADPDADLQWDTPDYADALGRGSWPQTAETQRLLWRHQHPTDCRKARFLVWRLWNAGLGADLHTYAQALMFAVKTGRVLVVDTEAVWWYAADRDPSSIECFFLPPSNCTLDDAADVVTLLPRHLGIQWSPRYRKMLPASKRRPIRKDGPRSVGNPIDRLVGDVSNAFDSSPYPEWVELGYQWRVGQAVRYLLRHPQPWFRQRYNEWVRQTFPGGPPAKMIGIHVRHGDKHKEMKLLPLSAYMRAAERMRREDPSLRDVFVSTEDPQVLVDARAYVPRWRFHWTEHVRSNEGSPKDYAMLIGPSTLAEISFVNLFMQAELCTHWVGTDKSNWNRLINEMRATGGKLDDWYLQLNRQPCVRGGRKVAAPLGTPPLPPPRNGWTVGC
eukprot:TRINITY_DN9508_c0_g1_i2.p1 TRINITY_DN9508_c0_g1~~TRINITY_DN9508_c0_g1_i2.p1  ORF type:complete len:483 (+),score=162.92 TRINITY_DN9508_c0_g1_i2:276-1724(+)